MDSSFKRKRHKISRNLKKAVRGTSRCLDVILDEEEDADQEADSDIAKTKRIEIEDRYNTLNIDKDGSICFF